MGRRLYITKKMVKQFGATDGCAGCRSVGPPHTKDCRKRISDKIAQDPKEAWRLREVEYRNEGKKIRAEATDVIGMASSSSDPAEPGPLAQQQPPQQTQPMTFTATDPEVTNGHDSPTAVDSSMAKAN